MMFRTSLGAAVLIAGLYSGCSVEERKLPSTLFDQHRSHQLVNADRQPLTTDLVFDEQLDLAVNLAALRDSFGRAFWSGRSLESYLFTAADTFLRNTPYGEYPHQNKILQALAEEASEIVNGNGIPFFTGDTLVAYIQSGQLTLDQARKYKETSLKGGELSLLNELGIEPEDYLGPRQGPKAIVAWPPKSPDNSQFYLPEFLNILKRLYDSYDVTFSVGTERDLYITLAQNQGIELLIIGGHGTPTSLNLANPNDDEGAYLSIDDDEFLAYLQGDERIVFFSCQLGKGKDSFAKQLAQKHRGPITASEEDLLGEDIVIDQIYPFNVNFVNKEGKSYSIHLNKIDS